MAGGRRAQTASGTQPPCLLLTWSSQVGVRCESCKDFPAPRAAAPTGRASGNLRLGAWGGAPQRPLPRWAEGQPRGWADIGPVIGTCSRCLLGRGSPGPSGRSSLPASLVRRTPLSAHQTLASRNVPSRAPSSSPFPVRTEKTPNRFQRKAAIAQMLILFETT